MQSLDVYTITLSSLADPNLVLFQLTSRGAEITKYPVNDRVIEVQTSHMRISDDVCAYLTQRRDGVEPSIEKFECVAGHPKAPTVNAPSYGPQ